MTVDAWRLRPVDRADTAVDAALALLLERGVDTITFDALGERTGMSVRLLELLHGSTEELLQDVWETRLRRPLQTAVEDAIAACSGDVAAARRCVRLMADGDETLRLGMEMLVTARRTDLLWDIVPATVLDWFDGLAIGGERATASQTATLAISIAVVWSALRRHVEGPVLLDAPSLHLLLRRAHELHDVAPVEPNGSWLSLVDPSLGERASATARTAHAVEAVLANSGLAGLSGRRVARRAGLPPEVLSKTAADELVRTLLTSLGPAHLDPAEIAATFLDLDRAAGNFATWLHPTGRLRRAIVLEGTLAAARRRVGAQPDLVQPMIDANNAAFEIMAPVMGSAAEAHDAFLFTYAAGEGLMLLTELGADLSGHDWKRMRRTVMETLGLPTPTS